MAQFCTSEVSFCLNFPRFHKGYNTFALVVSSSLPSRNSMVRPLKTMESVSMGLNLTSSPKSLIQGNCTQLDTVQGFLFSENCSKNLFLTFFFFFECRESYQTHHMQTIIYKEKIIKIKKQKIKKRSEPGITVRIFLIKKKNK